MRNYIEINGVSSLSLNGFAIKSLPPISKPPIRNMIEEIDGRDGDLITKLGYGAYDKEIEIGLFGESYDINDIIAFFNSEGEIIFSNEPDKIYYFTILNKIDFEKLVKFKSAIVTLHCQPFKYKKDEEPIEIEYEYVSGEGTNFTLDNTEISNLNIGLKGNTSQTGTPTPSSPIPVNVVSGDNSIEICGKNLFDKSKVVTGYLNENGTIYDTLNYNTSDYIIVEPNTSYYKTATTSPRTKYYDKNKQPLNITTYQDISIGGNEGTFTTPNNAYFLRFSYPIATVDANSIMLHKGTSATTYEPYNGDTYDIDLPVENLWGGFSNSFTRTHNGVQFTFNKDGTITAVGTTSTNYATSIVLSEATSNGIYISLPKGSYTVSGGGPKYSVEIYNKDTATRLAWINNTEKSTSFTINETVNIVLRIQVISNITINETVKLMLEKGSKANSYTPYGTTPIEMCKMPNTTNQDVLFKNIPGCALYDNTLVEGAWYKYRVIGKAVLNGSDNWAKHGSIVSWFYYDGVTDGYLNNAGSNFALCNYFTQNSYSNVVDITNGQFVYGTPNDGITKRLVIKNTDYTEIADFKTWLSTHNVTLYYVLETPTNTEITYEPLIEQLNAIKDAASKKGQTNIMQINNDLPFIISAISLKLGSDGAVIDNTGNIYAKPILEIEGSGTIGVSLNDNQIFSIDMSENNKVVIDSSELEAYNPDTNQLMNRQVTGNIENLKINSGENELKISGDLTKATITKYERWL